MPKCPHCSEDIEKLSGFVPEATLQERLKNKQEGHDKAIEKLNGKVAAANTERDEARVKLKEYEGLDVGKMEKRYAKAIERAELAEATLEQERETAAVNLVWANAQITDEETRDMVLYRYGKLDETGRPTLADYLAGPAKEDRFLAPLLGGSNGDTPAPEPQGNGNKHDPNAGIIPPPGGAGNTLKSVLQAPDYASKVKIAGSHENLEKLIGYQITRPREA